LTAGYKTDFELLRNQAVEWIQTNIPESGQKAGMISQVDAVDFSYQLPPFDTLNKGDIESERKRLTKYFDELKSKIGEIISRKTDVNQAAKKTEMVKLVTGKFHAVAGTKSNKTVDGIIEKIEKILPQLSRDKDTRAFEQQLQNIKTGNAATESYFYSELYDDIMRHIRQRKARGKILDADRQLSGITFISSLQGEAVRLKKQIGKVLQQTVCKQPDAEKIVGRLGKLMEKNERMRQHQLIAEQEQKYIKSRLVAAMRDLNYEVLAAPEMIDLESSDSLLMQVPDQNNFINLRFDASGKMLYNYLIPEHRDELSHDEKEVKLAEMEETCEEFKQMLINLKNQGLDIELQNEIRASDKTLIRLPDTFREQFNMTANRTVAPKKSIPRKRKMNK
jgi:hypothetical protein